MASTNLGEVMAAGLPVAGAERKLLLDAARGVLHTNDGKDRRS